MKSRYFAALAILLAGSSAQATVYTVNFSGVITDTGGFAGVGSTFTGAFAYDTAAQAIGGQSQSSSEDALYKSPTTFTLSSGSLNVNFAAGAPNGDREYWVVNAKTSGSDYVQDYIRVGDYSLIVRFTGSGLNVINDTNMLTTTAQYNSFASQTIQYSNSTGNILRGTITSLSVGASAVPEPASWAMMIGGFGMIGAALRQRRRPILDPGAAAR